MHENIERIIENTAKVDDIELKSNDLLIKAGIFKGDTAKLKNKMVWKNRKVFWCKYSAIPSPKMQCLR